MVVRTHVLTDIAPIHQPSHQLPHPPRDRPLQLDRQVRDTPRRIERPRGRERARRAGVQAPRAGATAIRLERRVRREVEREEERTEEEERAALGVEEIGVLPKPPESRAPGEVALQNRTGVYIRFADDRRTDLGLNPLVQRRKLLE